MSRGQAAEKEARMVPGGGARGRRAAPVQGVPYVVRAVWLEERREVRPRGAGEDPRAGEWAPSVCVKDAAEGCVEAGASSGDTASPATSCPGPLGPALQAAGVWEGPPRAAGLG